MNLTGVLIIAGVLIGAVLVGALVALFFISRRSQQVMQSLLNIMTAPDRARVVDASRVLQTIMADEIAKISECFAEIRETLMSQIGVAEKLRGELATRNEALVNIANDAVMRVSQMTDRVDNTVAGLRGVVDSDAWGDVANATDRFAATVGETLEKITATTKDSSDKIAVIDEKIVNWTENTTNLANELNSTIDTKT